MPRPRIFHFVICAASALTGMIASTAWAQAQPKLRVVASFSILGDMVERIGGDDVDLRILVGADGDAHVYRPTPDDAAAVASANLLVINGLGFEGWMERLEEASGFSGVVVVASDGVTRREGLDGHGAADPHAWQNLANGHIYVTNIAAALSTADPANAADYQARAAAYIAEIDTMDARVHAAFDAFPANRRVVITNHDAFGYFGDAYGVRFLSPIGLSTDAAASAADVAALIDQIRRDGVTAIFVENLSDARLVGQIAQETGITPGGALYSDALSSEDGPAATYLAMFEHNFRMFTYAMAR